MFVVNPSPRPPYSTGTVTPNRPSEASFCHSSSGGKSTLASIQRTYASLSSFSQKASNVSAIERCSSVNEKSTSDRPIRVGVRCPLLADEGARVSAQLRHRRLHVRCMVQPLDRITLQGERGVHTGDLQ